MLLMPLDIFILTLFKRSFPEAQLLINIIHAPLEQLLTPDLYLVLALFRPYL